MVILRYELPALLGDMAGVAMQLSAGARRAEASGGGDATIVQLLSALSTQVQRSLVDARRSVTALRTAPDALPPLHEQLAEAATRTFAGTMVAAHVERLGETRPYPPTVEAEIVGIITEAMMNARQHARCATVTVTCGYAPRALHVRVRDDGQGFDPSGETPPGHWGLVGMRERATRSLPKWGVERSAISAMCSPLCRRQYSAHEHAE